MVAGSPALCAVEVTVRSLWKRPRPPALRISARNSTRKFARARSRLPADRIRARGLSCGRASMAAPFPVAVGAFNAFLRLERVEIELDRMGFPRGAKRD